MAKPQTKFLISIIIQTIYKMDKNSIRKIFPSFGFRIMILYIFAVENNMNREIAERVIFK